MYQYSYLKTLDRLKQFFSDPLQNSYICHQTSDDCTMRFTSIFSSELYDKRSLRSYRSQVSPTNFFIITPEIERNNLYFLQIFLSPGLSSNSFAFFRRHLLASAFPSGSFLSSTTEVQYVVNNINRMFKIINWRIRMIENFLHILGP